MALEFKKAQKFEAKGRVALIGPAGSGKSFTALTLARELAGPTGKIACVDTEHGSLSKYADTFEFDTLELDVFSPENFLEALSAAERNGYAVFVCDSLSHFWMGSGGALEWVELAAKRSSSRDGMAGWKDFSPVERKMVDAMIASSCHVICTMRTKTEYSEVVENGKKKRVKIGLAPVQRQGLEYEFDVVGYMDDENAFITDKTRCQTYADKVIKKPTQKDFAPFSQWLKGANRESSKPADAKPEVSQTEKKEGFISTEKQAELDGILKAGRAKGLDTKQFSSYLQSIGYVRAEGRKPVESILESQFERAKEWLNNNIPR